MKQYLTLVLLLLITYPTNSQWVQISESFTPVTFAKSGNILISGGAGIYTSSNNGANWILTAHSNLSINSLAVIGNNVFAGVFYGGLYLSTNNGTNWPTTQQNPMSLNAVAVNQSYLFAAAGLGGGFYRSSNNGLNWNGIHPAGYTPYALAVKDSNVFISYVDNVMYNAFVSRSTNNGNSWMEVHSGLPDEIISCIGFSNLYVFAGCSNGGIYYSTNNGASWYLSSLGNNKARGFCYTGNNVFVATNNGFWKSSNNGLNWIQKDEGFIGHPGISSVFISDNYIYAGLGSIWRRPLSELITEIENKNSNISNNYILFQNYPNPFNPSTKIKYYITSFKKGGTGETGGVVTLKVFDILGKEIATLVNTKQNAGVYEVNFDGGNLTSGLYFYSLYVDENKIDTKKFLLLK